MMVAVAASCSYLTPLEPSCLMVYGPGKYQFSDFFKIGAPLTVVKLLAVLVVALNGLAAAKVQERMVALDGGTPSRRLLLTSVLVASISQAGWWTATIVGFLNAQR